MTCCTQNNAASSDGATLQLKFPESLPGAGPAMGRLMPLHSAGAEPESGTARPSQCSRQDSVAHCLTSAAKNLACLSGVTVIVTAPKFTGAEIIEYNI